MRTTDILLISIVVLATAIILTMEYGVYELPPGTHEINACGEYILNGNDYDVFTLIFTKDLTCTPYIDIHPKSTTNIHLHLDANMHTIENIHPRESYLLLELKNGTFIENCGFEEDCGHALELDITDANVINTWHSASGFVTIKRSHVTGEMTFLGCDQITIEDSNMGATLYMSSHNPITIKNSNFTQSYISFRETYTEPYIENTTFKKSLIELVDTYKLHLRGDIYLIDSNVSHPSGNPVQCYIETEDTRIYYTPDSVVNALLESPSCGPYMVEINAPPPEKIPTAINLEIH